MIEEVYKDLEEIQRDIEREYEEFARKDFECKLEHHKQIRPLLARRDRVIASMVPGDYWGRVLGRYEVGETILPRGTNNEVCTGWVRSLRADYLDGYAYMVEIEVNENEFVGNSTLRKKAYLFEGEVEKSGVRWKGDRRWPVFEFFETDTADLDVFDILYEVYVNSVTYFLTSTWESPGIIN
ncbi:hypothetical protein KMI_10g15490 [Encephalitozoon hellem]|nr:hypothetical protein KMI_10g15490 [Encephalitozoon hellem]